jgi:integrase
MSTKQLTDTKVRNLKPDPAKRLEIPDGGGLYLVVQPSGAKGWALRYRLHGKPQKLTLGSLFVGDIAEAPEPKIGGLLTLKHARKIAAEVAIQIGKGNDPVASKRRAKDEQDRRRENTFWAVAEAYMKREAGMKLDADGNPISFDESKLRTGHDRWLMLQRSILPTLGGMPISEIRKSDVIKLRDKIADGDLKDQHGRKIRGGEVAADHALAVIRKIFSWHASREDDFRSPLVSGMNLVKVSERKRSRTLNDDELRAIWKTASQLEGPFPAFIRFSLLTCSRRSEAAGLRWEEVDAARGWELPARRNKTKVPLMRPLSQAARDVLAAQPRIAGSEFAFTVDGRHAISGFSKHKKKFDKAVSRETKEPIPNWTIHDLRRTSRTLLSRCPGVPSDHAERCLGHVIGGIRGTYDWHEYYDEKKHAFDALAQQIAAIVDPPPANVLPFPQAAGGKCARPE